MGRLSIEIPEYQHKQIKALAAMRGVSIKDYIIERTLPQDTQESESMTEAQALSKLESFLLPRMEAAERGEFSSLTMQEILHKAQTQALV